MDCKWKRNSRCSSLFHNNDRACLQVFQKAIATFFQLPLCIFSWHNAYKMQFRHISLQNTKLLLFPSVKGCVWPEHSSSVGELSERQQRWNALVSLRETSDILGSFSYNPQPNKMLWEYFLTETFHQFISWKRILFERMKHCHRLNGLSLGQGMISVLSGHSTLQTWWLNDNGSISTKATLTAYSKSRSGDHARDS